MHYSFKHETVLPSLKNDYHTGLAHFGKDQFRTPDDNEGEKNVIKTLDSFSFDAVHPIQVPIKKPITKNAKTLFKQFFSDTENEDPVESRAPQDKIPNQTDLSLVHKTDYDERNHHFTEK